jgi:hypothetical protein
VSDFQAFGSAIYAALGGTAANPPVFQGLAPQSTTPPYTVFQRQTAVDNYTFTGSGISADYVVKVVSNRRAQHEAQAMYGSVHATVQNAALSISGYQTLRCRRTETLEYRDGDGFWHVGGVYRIDAWKA